MDFKTAVAKRKKMKEGSPEEEASESPAKEKSEKESPAFELSEAMKAKKKK